MSDNIQKLLHKYDRPGPRYTSYPTVPEWSDKFSPEDYIQALKRASETNEPLSLYVHIPFCRKRCFYCGCNTTITKKPEKPADYLLTLKREIEIVTNQLDQRNRLIQMHWGGGTPTYLTTEQIEWLFNEISAKFEFLEDAEIAIEVDPRVTTTEQLELLAKLGFNRISLGVQDFNEKVQTAIGRNQTQDQTLSLFKTCRELGFNGINIDLIYGLPFQTVQNFSKSIQQVIDLKTDRVAVYSYAHLPSIITHQRRIDENALPQTEQKYKLFATAIEKFIDAGYVQIGMDHFARSDDELALAVKNGTLHRNFMGYTTKRTSDMLGIGMSAIGDIGGSFAQNYSKLDTYMRPIAENQNAVFRGCVLTEDDKIRRWTIISIMCNGVLDFTELEKQFGIKYAEYFTDEDKELAEFIGDGLMERTESGLKVTAKGMIFVRNISLVFDAYMRSKRDGKTPLFSRTI
ncbi:MAG: oxygen-independent coproporphyrinogen III oxidase [candidate division Zixibacteria bacterium]|nr:oxygen-independent coproporphyrinogen III oxidase [candidate division Zixibacteria bacterium]